MMIDIFKNKYSAGEPIFLYEVPTSSNGYLRQQMKKLADSGSLTRVCNGVYYIPYKTILGTQGKLSIKKYIEKKFLVRNGKTIGYYSGVYIANQYGFTTQNPACYEVCSNAATTKNRKIIIDENEIVVYKPSAIINDNNIEKLRFLDLLICVDKYSELPINVSKKKIKNIMKKEKIDILSLREFLPLYPIKIYKCLYKYCGEL